ncbi:PHB depolymerase family esterase [Variovorax sp. dw_954]|uniref:extracellular catalytic domain type 1 short-chain-length polyhydroxyalkanoate depolymerase n=1 Tax=Variovorax sp. dw_954 TaxID=2720078 RepID=UPI001BD48F81|nr:PHB depolymerase family esterase [Variovorax sp. dw_954]
MNPVLQRLMNEATRLTRSGNLQAATAAIQRALHIGKARPAAGETTTPPPTPSAAEGDVIEAEVRVIIDPQPSTAFARAEPAEVVQPVEINEIDEIDEPVIVRDIPEPEQWTDGHFAHDGRTLAYKLYLPPRTAAAAAKPMPLVLMLHGCTQNPADFAAGTRMNDLARAQGFAVLYPAQTQRENAQGCWNWFKTQHQQRGRGEPALLAALTQTVMADHAIDPARVYVAGLSAGGAMADILGRRYPDIFAAVGVHSGLPMGAASDLMSALAAMHGGGAASAPHEGKALPVIVFHGDADATVNARNGAAIVAAASGGYNGAGAAPQVTQGQSAGNQRFTRTTHASANGRAYIEHWQLHGAGHAWSGGSRSGSFTDPNGIDASAEMLRFFLAHSRS